MKKQALPPLNDRISFLMHRIEAKLEVICNPYFRRFDVALHNSRMLVLLLESGQARVGDLVSRMALPQSTISHQLRELEKRKLILRTPSMADSRSVIVELTARGRQVEHGISRVGVDHLFDGKNVLAELRIIRQVGDDDGVGPFFDWH